MGIDFFRVAPPPMFLKYNLRALNYSVESLQPVLETFRYPNLSLEIQTRARTKNDIINLMIRMIFTRCSGILVFRGGGVVRH